MCCAAQRGNGGDLLCGQSDRGGINWNCNKSLPSDAGPSQAITSRHLFIFPLTTTPHLAKFASGQGGGLCCAPLLPFHKNKPVDSSCSCPVEQRLPFRLQDMRRPVWSLKYEVGLKKLYPSDTSTHSSINHQTAVGLQAQHSAYLHYYGALGPRCRRPQARGSTACSAYFKTMNKHQLSYFPKGTNRLLAAR